MDDVVTAGDERWRAWIAANGWDPCECCNFQGYHRFGSDKLQCAECDGFGFIIPEGN